jgi:hypothetical protein
MCGLCRCMMPAVRQSHFMDALSIILAALAGLFTLSVVAETVDFSGGEPRKLPPHWIGTQTGTGEAKWSIEKDADAPGRPCALKQSGQAAYPICISPCVLKQSGQADYPVCIKDDARLKDGFVEVRFKPVSGKEDQAGGVIWRVKDKDNYYVCRANALEDNVVLYKTVAGKRSSLDIVGRKGGYGVKEKVAPAQWHTLRVEFKDNHFKVIFNGKHLFDVEDNTFSESGTLGVWTKADSVTLFNGFTYGSAN